ncbi:AAA family ATPase [Streptomyces griseorubiginosus]|uniref:AAA family ATPase n=1 Tax=Streptomyces griseorubiginosus TaxID=67304 RepID=UPI001AD7232C|nr:AAA family ATPase [Streptomyces griseorubiginosus]MBO4257164.1 AAA family ATPase [Streptomyces griseorubiginosus]
MDAPDTGSHPADADDNENPPEPDTAVPAPFVITKEHRRFTEFADAVRRDRYIGLCYGPPGVGKTLSARRYAGWGEVAPYLDAFTLLNGQPIPESALTARTVVYTPEVYNTPRSVQKSITFYQDRLNYAVQLATDGGLGGPDTAARFTTRAARNTELLVVDEADRLKTPSLEQLRDHYDRTGVGVVLIGMPGIEKSLARYPQLYSRVGFVHHYRPLSPNEQHLVITRHWPRLALDDLGDFTTAEAVAAITRITSGNFRLTSRLVAQIERVMDINQLSTVTAEVVETARESLVVGVL